MSSLVGLLIAKIMDEELKSSDIEIFLPDFSTRLPLQYADGGIQAGFPSPPQDFISETIDLNKDLIRHPAATFYGRVVGDSMIEENIDEGDILVIDRSLECEDGDLAVCYLDGEFTLKRVRRVDGRKVYLVPSNHRYRTIEVTPDNEFMVWGIVVYLIKSTRHIRDHR